MPVGISVFLSASLSLAVSLTPTRTQTHTLSLSQPRAASAPSLRVSQSSPSPLSLTPSPLSLPSLYSIAPASRSIFTTSSWHFGKASCSGVSSFCGEGEAISAQASSVPRAVDSKAPPPPTLRRYCSLNYLLRWRCYALPTHALHPPPTDPRLRVGGAGATAPSWRVRFQVSMSLVA